MRSTESRRQSFLRIMRSTAQRTAAGTTADESVRRQAIIYEESTDPKPLALLRRPLPEGPGKGAAGISLINTGRDEDAFL